MSSYTSQQEAHEFAANMEPFDYNDDGNGLGLDVHISGSDTSGTDETSPTDNISMADITRIADAQAPNNLSHQAIIISLLRRPGALRRELSTEDCLAFESTAQGTARTCTLFDKGKPCTSPVQRGDRWRHHIQGHLEIKPYACSSSNKVTPETACDDTFFSSTAARDTHVRNKRPVVCQCRKEVLPKNMSRHKLVCPAST